MRNVQEIRERAILLYRLANIPYDAGIQWAMANDMTPSELCADWLYDADNGVKEWQAWIADHVSSHVSDVLVNRELDIDFGVLVDEVNQRYWREGLWRQLRALLWVLGIEPNSAEYDDFKAQVLPEGETYCSVLGLNERA